MAVVDTWTCLSWSIPPLKSQNTAASGRVRKSAGEMLMAPTRRPEVQSCSPRPDGSDAEVQVLHHLCTFSLTTAWREGVMYCPVSVCLLVLGRNFSLLGFTWQNGHPMWVLLPACVPTVFWCIIISDDGVTLGPSLIIINYDLFPGLQGLYSYSQ